MTKFLAGASALALACLPRLAVAAEAAPLSELTVTAAPTPGLDLAAIPTTVATVSAGQLARTTNIKTPEDAVRYLPNVLVRQRHIGDTQSPVTTRTSGVGASARSLIYVDGLLISALIGNNNTSASPKWGLVSPSAIARVDVLYGPFSAAYAGNSIGSVIAFTTRMPQGPEGDLQVQGAVQAFDRYGEKRTLGTARVAGDVGDRRGPFAFRLSVNHLDTSAQPLGYATATVPAASSGAGLPVTGAVPGANRNGQPILFLGSTSIEHQVQDNLSGRATLDLTPAVTAAYAFGLFQNRDDATAASYLRDGSGAPAWSGTVNVGGKSYAIAPSAFSAGVYRLDETQLAQGLSLTGKGPVDWDVAVTRFDYLTSRQRTPSAALPGAFNGGAGSDAVLNGTGWSTLDAKAAWRAVGLSGGLHWDGFSLNNPRYALADWKGGPDGALQSASAGHTETQALWLQEQAVMPHGLTATAGLRWESWRAFGGINVSASPALNVVQPSLHAEGLSPKGTLAWTPAKDWMLKASVGVAYRFPTVTELYQTVTVGAVLATPDPRLKPERALSSELSAERAFAHGSLRLSIFDERITNTLLSQTALLPGGASASFVQNVDRTRVTGVELVGERRDLFIPGLGVSGWITYLDARIERDRAFAAAVGKQLPQLPRLRGAVTVSWSPRADLDLSASARYSGRAYASIDNSDRYADTWQGFGAYLVADIHARWRASKHWEVEGGIDNLNDRAYVLFHPFPRRTAVMSLKYRF